MRTRAVLWLGLVGLTTSGCLVAAPSMTVPTKRIALAPLPGAPPQLRGSPGAGLAARIALTRPTAGAQGAGVAVPSVQPELLGVFKFAEHAYGSVDVLLIPGDSTKAALSDSPRVSADLSWAAMIGFGYDFQIAPQVGINVSAEGGLTFVSVASTIAGSAPTGKSVELVAGRIAAAPYFEAKMFRVFAGAVAATDVWSQPDATLTTCFTCGAGIDSGRTETRPVVMAGGGARFRPHNMVSLALEVWVPLTTEGIHHPPQLNFAVQFGDLDFSRSQREPPPVEPTPVVSPPPSAPVIAPPVQL